MKPLNDAINKLDVTIRITTEHDYTATHTHTHTHIFLTNCIAIKSRSCVDGHYIKDVSLHLLSDLSAALGHFLESDVIGKTQL